FWVFSFSSRTWRRIRTTGTPPAFWKWRRSSLARGVTVTVNNVPMAVFADAAQDDGESVLIRALPLTVPKDPSTAVEWANFGEDLLDVPDRFVLLENSDAAQKPGHLGANCVIGLHGRLSLGFLRFLTCWHRLARRTALLA